MSGILAYIMKKDATQSSQTRKTTLHLIRRFCALIRDSQKFLLCLLVIFKITYEIYLSFKTCQISPTLTKLHNSSNSSTVQLNIFLPSSLLLRATNEARNNIRVIGAVVIRTKNRRHSFSNIHPRKP